MYGERILSLLRMSELGTVGRNRQVGGCQADAGGLVLLGEGCVALQPSYPLCRIGLLDL